MQTLGLSDSTPRSESRLKSLFWPSIESGADVDYLAVQGFWVCTFVGLLSTCFLDAGRPAHHWIAGISICFILGGVGVREHNPFAAAVMLVYYLVDFLASFIFVSLNSPGIGVVKVIIIGLLLSNLRATWIAGDWKPDSEEAALPPRLRRHILRQALRQVAGLYLAKGESVSITFYSVACLALITGWVIRHGSARAHF